MIYTDGRTVYTSTSLIQTVNYSFTVTVSANSKTSTNVSISVPSGYKLIGCIVSISSADVLYASVSEVGFGATSDFNLTIGVYSSHSAELTRGGIVACTFCRV